MFSESVARCTLYIIRWVLNLLRTTIGGSYLRTFSWRGNSVKWNVRWFLSPSTIDDHAAHRPMMRAITRTVRFDPFWVQLFLDFLGIDLIDLRTNALAIFTRWLIFFQNSGEEKKGKAWDNEKTLVVDGWRISAILSQNPNFPNFSTKQFSSGVYGDVVRVKILYNKKDNALIQYSEPQQAQLGKFLAPRGASRSLIVPFWKFSSMHWFIHTERHRTVQ